MILYLSSVSGHFEMAEFCMERRMAHDAGVQYALNLQVVFRVLLPRTLGIVEEAERSCL